jgi:signal transduction histidine kinase
VAATLPPLRTDPGKLRLILRNLLSNALKFTEAGSVSLVVTSEDNGVSIAITDTGVGIPTHALSEIFEPFYQVTDVNEPRRGGVGLGLHIVKRLLDLLGGRITVDSEYGRGSTFTVRLPWSGPPEEE